MIVAGGAAGITTAGRLGRAEVHDVALIEPSDRRYYQPLWPFTGWERSAHGPDSAGRYASKIPNLSSLTSRRASHLISRGSPSSSRRVTH